MDNSIQYHIQNLKVSSLETKLAEYTFSIYCSECRDDIRKILSDSSHKKMSRDDALRAVLASVSEKLSLQRDSNDSLPSPPPNFSLVTSTFWSLCGQQLQSMALDTGLR